MKLKIDSNPVRILFFLLIVNFRISWGQETKLRFTIYNQEQGLNSSTISQIDLDSKGFLWLLSESGLSRFDGYHFINQSYKSKEGKYSQTPRVHTFSMHPCGTILINTHQGLAISNINKTYFENLYSWEEGNEWGDFIKNKNYFIFLKQNKLVVFDSLGHLLSDKDLLHAKLQLTKFSFGQNILAIKNNKLGVYNFITYSFSPIAGLPVGFLNANEIIINDLPFDKNQKNIHIGTTDYCLNLLTNRISPLPAPLTSLNTIFNKPFQLLQVNDCNCYIATEKTLYVVTRSKNAYRIESKKLPFEITFLQIKSKNCIWIATKDGGLYTSNSHLQKIEKVNCPSSSAGLNTDLNIEALRSNDLCTWYTSPGNGLIKIEESATLFSSFYPPIFNASGAQNPAKLNVRAICDWQKNKVLVGTLQGLFEFNLEKKAFGKLALGASNDFSNFPTSALVKDPEGDIWVANWNELGLYCIAQKDKSVTNLLSTKDSKKIKGTIRSLYFDHRGNLWIGTPDNKIYVVNWRSLKNKKEAAVFQELTPKDAHIRSFGIVFNFMQADSLRLFIASESGLLEYNFLSKHLSLHTIVGPLNESIKNIRSIVGGGYDALYLGTHGNGIIRYHFLNHKAEVFKEPNGLSNNIVYSLQIDSARQFLWAGTNNGLSRFNIQTHSFTSFSTRDGLQNAEFNTNASADYQNIYYLFGGVQGITVFNPYQIKEPRFYNPVYITEIKINGKVYELKTDSEKLALDFQENNLSFKFAGLGKWRNEEYNYAYQLQGVDTNWIFCGTQREVSYLNLKPGDYLFKVRVYDFYGHYTELEKTFSFHIATPWFKKWWFYLLMVLAIFSVIMIAIRFKLAQVHSLQSMRNTIAKDLHDEVGANLSNIALFIAVLKQKMNESTTESIPLIDKINQFAQSSQDSMTDIVWMINSNNDEFENLTIKMKDYTSLIAEDSPIQINYQLDHSLSKIKLDMLSRKNIYLFFKEALNNAIKHSNATKIDIITKWTGNELHLQIIDNGKGFDNTQTYKGNGLKNLEKRAEQLDGQLIINSTSSAGTCIELICSPLSNKSTH